MITTTVSIEGDANFIAKVERIAEELNNFAPIFEKLADPLRDYYSDNVFNSMGGVFGQKWAALAPSTVAQKKGAFRSYSSVPLVATGQMRHSFYPVITPMEMQIKNDTPYFVYHQSTEPRSKLPRRQMLGINSDVKNIIKQVVESHVRHIISENL